MLYVFLLFFQKCLSDCIDHFSQTYCKCRQNFENDNADRCRINVQFECKGIRRILTETNFNFKILVHVILCISVPKYKCSSTVHQTFSPFAVVCSAALSYLASSGELPCSCPLPCRYIYLQNHKLKLYEHRSDS